MIERYVTRGGESLTTSPHFSELMDDDSRDLTKIAQDFKKIDPSIHRRFTRFGDKIAHAHANQARAWRIARYAAASVASASLALGIGTLYEQGYDPSHAPVDAKHLLLKDPKQLSVLGLCAPELTAQAQYEDYREVVGQPTGNELSADDYVAGANLARTNGVPCTAAPDANVSGLTANSIAMFDVSSACDSVAQYAQRFNDANAQEDGTVIYTINRDLAKQVGTPCVN